MVTTRRQKQGKAPAVETTKPTARDSKKRSEQNVTDDDSSPPSKKKSKRGDNARGHAPKAKCEENQALLNELQELVEAVVAAQAKKPKLRYQAMQLNQVIDKLSQFDSKITSGEALASGKDKVSGLGPTTAKYIDDFLETGKIAAIQHYRDILHGDDTDSNSETNEKKNKNEEKDENIIMINRAPILALWVVVVCERQGYTHDEALTYAKWIQTILARSKGKKLGKIKEDKDTSSGSSGYTDNKVHVFGSIKVPVQSLNEGKRLAVMGSSTIDPNEVERYLISHLGPDLKRIQDSFEQLAFSMEPSSLRDNAYDLYEDLRPEWQGWGKPGKFDLKQVEALKGNH